MGARFNKTNFVTTQFYQLPVQFYTDNKYRSLTQNAKVAYAILRNQAQLSYRNGFFEDNGDVYIYYSWKKLEEVIGVSHGTVKKILSDLEQIGLIERCKQFYNSASKIYVRQLDEPESAEQLVSDDICPENIADDVIQEIKQVNEIANMDFSELSEAMTNGSVKPFVDKHLSTAGSSTKNELSESKNYTSSSITPSSDKNYTPKVQNLYSGGVQKMNSRCIENEQGVQKVAMGCIKSDTQTISNINIQSNTDSYPEDRERTERGKGKDARARARIFVDNPSDLSAQDTTGLDSSSLHETSEGLNQQPGAMQNSSGQDDISELIELYTENIQPNPVPLVIKALQNLYSKYGKDIIVEAITQTALSSTAQEKKGFNYVASVVERLAGKKNNNYTNNSKSTDIPDASLNSIKTMPNKSAKPSMEDSQKNIHGMIEQYFTANAGNMSEGANGL